MNERFTGTVEERIRSAFDNLSPNHRRLVEYLLESDSAAAFSTARQLAEALNMSESTVVRLAPELGYDGFPALQEAFQRRLLSRIEWKAPMRQGIDAVPKNPGLILQQVIENDLTALRNVMSTVPAETFERAVAAVLEARTVYILGLRTSAAHALYTTMRLRLVRPNTRLISSNVGDLPDQMLALEPGDLLIAVCYLRYCADTVRALQYARNCGVKTIVVTDDPISPPAKAADIVLVAHGLSSMLLHSLVAPLSLLNALVAAVAVLDRENASRSIVRSYEVIESFEVLLAPDAPSELQEEGGNRERPQSATLSFLQ